MEWNNDACVNFGPGGVFEFADNGLWDSDKIIADNSSVTTITIDLGDLYSSVDGWMNYGFSEYSGAFGEPFIAALAEDGLTVLETYDLSIVAPIDAPTPDSHYREFRGIARDTAEIRYFQFGGSYLAIADFLSVTDVSEPATLALLGIALVVLGFSRRKRAA